MCSFCGDGFAQGSEKCDPGDGGSITADDGDCPGRCRPAGGPNQCTCSGCGNGQVDWNETCDPTSPSGVQCHLGGGCTAAGEPNECQCEMVACRCWGPLRGGVLPVSNAHCYPTRGDSPSNADVYFSIAVGGTCDSPTTPDGCRASCPEGRRSMHGGYVGGSSICQGFSTNSCFSVGSVTKSHCADGIATGEKTSELPKAYCEAIANCGNGVLDPGEECDDGNNFDGAETASGPDGCDRDCTLTGCGNSIATRDELCDGIDQGGCVSLDCAPGCESGGSCDTACHEANVCGSSCNSCSSAPACREWPPGSGQHNNGECPSNWECRCPGFGGAACGCVQP